MAPARCKIRPWIFQEEAKGHGCEFLDQRTLERIVRAPVYYTYAYSAWQKGSVENFNRQLRRHLGKGTPERTLRQ